MVGMQTRLTKGCGMKVLFLHGMESTPGGKKPSYFLQHGHAVSNPALPADDFEESVRIGQQAYDQERPDLVVGSSRGGAVAMNLSLGQTPMLLLCPAWKRWGKAVAVKAGTLVLHSPQDQIVPFADSRELVEASPGSRLVEIGSDHRLADPEALAAMLAMSESLTVAPH